MGIKIILSILCAVILLTGCGGDKADEPVIATMKVSESNLDFTSAGGNAEVELTANCDWVIHEKPDWVSVTPNKGNGDATLKIRVSSNNEYNSRNGNIVILNSSSDKRVSINIDQSQKDDVIIEDNSISFTWQGGTVVIPVQYTEYPDVTIDGNPDWLHVELPTRSLYDGTITITADANKGELRNAVIDISAGDATRQIEVSQSGYVAVESISFRGTSPIEWDSINSFQLAYDVYPADYTSTLLWSSSNGSVAEITDDGTVYPMGNGSTIIKVESKEDGVSAEIELIVKIKAERIFFAYWSDYPDLNGNTGWFPISYPINGSWGYVYQPVIKAEPENAYIDDLVLESSNTNLVTIGSNYDIICNEDRKTGDAIITVYSAYSDVSAELSIQVRPYYLIAGLGNIQQSSEHFYIQFSGFLYTNNPTDEFFIDGVSIVDENNQVVTYGFTSNTNGTNSVRWQTADYVDLSNYGIYVISEEFYERIAKWKAIVTFRNPKYEGVISESVSIDPHTQY